MKEPGIEKGKGGREVHRVQLLVRDDPQGIVKPRWLRVTGLVCADYTTRDGRGRLGAGQEGYGDGATSPAGTPVFYPVAPYLLMTGGRITVQMPGTSPEVEWVVIVQEDQWFVTVGSDHTDRELEKTDPLRAKQMCPKVISPFTWPMSAVESHWNQLRLRCWVQVGGGQWIPYQDEAASELMHPAEQMDMLQRSQGPVRTGAVLFGGTVPLLTSPTDADRVRIELWDPANRRGIRHEYEVRRAVMAAS